MGKLACKGTSLQLDIASVYTAIAQIIELDGPEPEVETYDATALDSGAGKEHEITGYVEPGEVSGQLFWDPALANHQNLTDLIAAPANGKLWKIVYSDGSEVAFAGIFKSIGSKVAMNDGLKAPFSIKLSGIPTYPT